MMYVLVLFPGKALRQGAQRGLHSSPIPMFSLMNLLLPFPSLFPFPALVELVRVGFSEFFLQGY